MGWILFWILGVLALLALVVSVFAPRAGGTGDRRGIATRNLKSASRNVAVIAGCLAVLSFVLGGIREVPTRSVGVPTAFGSVESSLRPGLHWKLPWTNVNILDETIQTTSYDDTNCLDVRIGGQQTACLDVTLQWRVMDSGASQLFNDYNGQGSANRLGQQPSTAVPGGIMGTITDAVVIRELQQVVNQVLGDYNPIQDVAASATAGNSQFSTFGPIVLRDMRQDLAGKIQVLNAFLPLLRYDSATQSRLNQIQQQVGETAIANEEYATNVAQAKANNAIAGSVSADPGVLEYECLQLIQTAEKTGYTGLPPTLSCLGGSGSVVSLGK